MVSRACSCWSRAARCRATAASAASFACLCCRRAGVRRLLGGGGVGDGLLLALLRLAQVVERPGLPVSGRPGEGADHGEFVGGAPGEHGDHGGRVAETAAGDVRAPGPAAEPRALHRDVLQGLFEPQLRGGLVELRLLLPLHGRVVGLERLRGAGGGVGERGAGGVRLGGLLVEALPQRVGAGLRGQLLGGGLGLVARAARHRGGGGRRRGLRGRGGRGGHRGQHTQGQRQDQ